MPDEPQNVPAQTDQHQGLNIARPELRAPASSPVSLSPAPPVENPPWNIWDVLLVMVAGFVALVIAGVAAAIIVAAVMATKHLKAEQIDSDLRFVLPIQLAIYAGAIGMMYHTIRVRYRQSFGAGVRWSWPRRIWPWLVTGVLLATVVQLAERVVPMPNNLPIEKFFSTPLNAYLMGVLGVVIAPVVEELFFRGFLYPVVARRFGVGGGVLLTGAVFAVFHAGQLGYTWAPLLIMLVVGVTLTAIRAITKSVAASTLTHVTYNFILMATLWVVTDHFHHLERIAQ